VTHAIPWLRRQLREYRDGARILASRRFWIDARWYWLTCDGGLPRAMDDWNAHLSERTGKPYQRRYPPGGPETWPWPSSRRSDRTERTGR
jgi:hypothetical protein